MYFGNDLQSSQVTFVSLEFESGHLGVRMKFCDFEKYTLTPSDTFADGNQYLVIVQKDVDSVKLYVDNVMQFDELVSTPTCDFNSTYLIFGGSVPHSGTIRRRRSSVTDVTDFSSVDSYKGTVQDVQLNDKFTLQFYELSDPSLSTLSQINASQTEGLTEGEQSDPVCNQTTPCENNGSCFDVFFNDYR